jgi:hypothetical protein
MRKNAYIILGALATVVVALLLYSQLTGRAQDGAELEKPGRFCAQVITPAKNLETGEIKDFPSSCIPDGWERIAPVPIPMEADQTEPSGTTNGNSSDDMVCAQVVTPARNKQTGETKEFPTSCIPDGWERLDPNVVN